MSVNTVTNVLNTSDATFRAWAQAINNVLDVNWELVADSGDIDLVTVTAPVATDTVAGYQIWRSNDTGGALTQFYIKIEYGSGASSATRPAIWITVGWGSNGAGTLTGQLSTRTQVTPTATPASGTAMNIAAGSGYLVIALYQATTNANMVLSIERNRSADLAFKNEVHIIGRSGGGGAWYSQCVDQSNLFTDAAGAYQSIQPANATTPRAGLAGLGIVFGMAPSPTSPSMNILGAEEGSLGVGGDVLSVTLYGASHAFKIQTNANGAGASADFMTVQVNTCLLTRYE